MKWLDLILGRTYWRILDFSFGGRTENGHEMALELVSGVDFRCIVHHVSSLTRLKRSWGQVCTQNLHRRSLMNIPGQLLIVDLGRKR